MDQKEMDKIEMGVVIEEIARVALGMVLTEIREELDLSDEYLLEVRDHLEAHKQVNQLLTKGYWENDNEDY